MEESKNIKQKIDLLTSVFDKHLSQTYGGILFGSILNPNRLPKDIDIFLFYREDLDFIPFKFYENILTAYEELKQHGITPDISVKHATDLEHPESAIRCFRMANALLYGNPFGWKLDVHSLPQKDLFLRKDVQYQTTSHELLDYCHRLLIHEPDNRIILRNSILIIGFCACWLLDFDYNLVELKAYEDLSVWLGEDNNKLVSLVQRAWNDQLLFGSELELLEHRVAFVQLASLMLACTYDKTKKYLVVEKIITLYKNLSS